ncbi:UNVERIFIED_CONTAM: Armadillo repeat-containing protein 8 [Siphonaria sp. JEL0065]|nr:Armadillo repeat-containing protein 8 [Siphonaria sp. JEL0065]
MPGFITLTPEYGYVLAVGTLSTLYPIVLGGAVGGARKRAKIPYPHMYATQAECAEDHNKHIFNCYQRAHHNYLENYPQYLFLLLTAGIEHPVAAAVSGGVWLVGRVLFSRNYQTGDPAKRNSGLAWIHYVGLTLLLGMSIKTSARFAVLAWEKILARLFAAPDVAAQAVVLREIKNAVIGNRAKKEAFASSEAKDSLIAILCDALAPVEAKETAAIVAGSLASVSVSIKSNKMLGASLVANLNTKGHDALTCATLRALQNVTFSVDATFAHGLVELLGRSRKVATLAAQLISTLGVHAPLFVVAGALDALLHSLSVDQNLAFAPLVDSSLDALATLVKDDKQAAVKLVGLFAGSERSVALLLRLLNDTKAPMTRLLAAQCLANICKLVTLDNQRIPAVLLLPALISLFTDSAINNVENLALLERAPRVFAGLVDDSEALQKLALEGDAISKLAAILSTPQVRAFIGTLDGNIVMDDLSEDSAANTASKASNLLGGGGSNSGSSTVGGAAKSSKSYGSFDGTSNVLLNGGGSRTFEKVAESCLLAISAVCSLREDCRKEVIDAKLLPLIVTALSHPSTNLRSAACKCTRSLSRSVKNLRTSLVDAGISTPLFTLLNDPSLSVQTSASATLCNIVLDFSPMKKTVIENGGVERIVKLVASEDYQLKLNSVWAIKNLLYQAGSDVKSRVMEELGWDVLKKLIFDPHIGIQEQSLNLLRNLVCGKEDDIDTAFSGFGEAAFSVLFDKKLSGHGCVSSDYDGVILQTLYIIVNIATGNERHKGLIVGSDLIMGNVAKFMNHEKSLIRLATVWCVLNLTEPDDLYPKFSQERLERLRSFGFQEQLKQMLTDSDPDVRDRVKTALKNLGTSTSSGTGLERGVIHGGNGGGGSGEDFMDIDDAPGPVDLEGMQDLSTYLAGRSG